VLHVSSGCSVSCLLHRRAPQIFGSSRGASADGVYYLKTVVRESGSGRSKKVVVLFQRRTKQEVHSQDRIETWDGRWVLRATTLNDKTTKWELRERFVVDNTVSFLTTFVAFVRGFRDHSLKGSLGYLNFPSHFQQMPFYGRFQRSLSPEEACHPRYHALRRTNHAFRAVRLKQKRRTMRGLWSICERQCDTRSIDAILAPNTAAVEPWFGAIAGDVAGSRITPLSNVGSWFVRLSGLCFMCAALHLHAWWICVYFCYAILWLCRRPHRHGCCLSTCCMVAWFAGTNIHSFSLHQGCRGCDIARVIAISSSCL